MPTELCDPKYKIDKLESSRRTLHAAIRMVWANEDPLAINLLAQSADRLTADLMGQDSDMLWDSPFVIKKHKTELMRIIRDASNFLKHADRDPQRKLSIYDLQSQAEIAIFCGIVRYRELKNTISVHMKMYLGYYKLRYPDHLQMDDIDLSKIWSMEELSDPRYLRSTWGKCAQIIPEYAIELSQDTNDSC
jgi:hypothetical protein